MLTFRQFIIENYRGEHEAPDKENGAPLHDVTSNSIYPEDYYTHSHYYNAGESYDNESHAIIRSKKGRPNAYVTVYRAIPKNSPKGTKINPGDWITINRKYAHDHGHSNLGGKGNYRIVSKNLRANEIYTDGNSIHEWGYHPTPRDVEYDNAKRERWRAQKRDKETAMSPEEKKVSFLNCY